MLTKKKKEITFTLVAACTFPMSVKLFLYSCLEAKRAAAVTAEAPIKNGAAAFKYDALSRDCDENVLLANPTLKLTSE